MADNEFKLVMMSLEHVRNEFTTRIQRENMGSLLREKWQFQSITPLCYLGLFWIFYLTSYWNKSPDNFGCQNFRYITLATGILDGVVMIQSFINYRLMNNYIENGTWYFHKKIWRIHQFIRFILATIMNLGYVYGGITLFYLTKSCLDNKYPVFVIFCLRIIPLAIYIFGGLIAGIGIIIYIILTCFNCIINQIQDTVLERTNGLIQNWTRETVEDIGILEEKECCICRDNQPNSRIKPCNHNPFCDSCLRMVNKCPICRKDITTVQVLKSGISPVFNHSHPKEEYDIESQIEN